MEIWRLAGRTVMNRVEIHHIPLAPPTPSPQQLFMFCRPIMCLHVCSDQINTMIYVTLVKQGEFRAAGNLATS